MIEQEFVNVTDLVIKRPVRTGPGGDTNPAADVTIASGLRCIHQRTHRVRKSREGVDVVVEALIFLDPVLPNGSPLPEVCERDYLICTLPGTGRLSAPFTVLAVAYESLGAEIDHIELEV